MQTNLFETEIFFIETYYVYKMEISHIRGK